MIEKLYLIVLKHVNNADFDIWKCLLIYACRIASTFWYICCREVYTCTFVNLDCNNAQSFGSTYTDWFPMSERLDVIEHCQMNSMLYKYKKQTISCSKTIQLWGVSITEDTWFDYWKLWQMQHIYLHVLILKSHRI